MEVIINKIEHYLKTEDYIDGLSCFMDIETTGLSRDREMIYLIGLLFFDIEEDKWILNQYFANSKDKELDVLERFIEDADKFDNIITYNGDSFDIPFINHRLGLLKSKMKLDKNKSFDLYRLIRQNKDYLNLENLKLKTIEESLGYYREDIYSGYDCIGFYKTYLESQDIELKERVLKHNHDDLIHMLDIMEILDVLKSRKTININLSNKDYQWLIESISFKKDTLEIKGSIDPNLSFDIKTYDFKYNLVTEEHNRFLFQLNVFEGYIEENSKAFFINLNEFPNLDLTCLYNEFYSIPKNIFLLSIGNRPLINNIKLLIPELIKI